MPKFSKVYIEKDDFRQIGVVTRNELIKNVRGKRFLASLVLILLVFSLITVMPYANGKGWDATTIGSMLSSYLSYVVTFSVLIVGLVGSVTLVSEYEERTALILFTRPIKKTSIFIGKFCASFITGVLLILVYYIGVDIMTLAFHGTVPVHLVQSFCMCAMYVFAATGIAFVFSAVMKKASMCIIFTILALLVVIPVASMMIQGDNSFMLDQAGNSTLTCVPEYVDSYNKGVQDMYDALDTIIGSVEKQYEATTDPVQKEYYAQLIQGMNQIFAMIKSFATPIAYPDLAKDAAIMFVWGFISLAAAWVLFIRREF
jgi:ABC-2 type transport system permease protein